jgi:predicted DNA-binding transcriptional regulator AlpA
MNKLLSDVESAMWNDRMVAHKLGVSRSMVHKLLSAGKLPQPVRLGRCLRWRAAVIEAWIADSCPNPQNWQGRADA